MLDIILHWYLVGIVASIIGCCLFISIELHAGNKFLFTSKQVWLGILFYTVVSWLGLMVYIYCIYLTYYKRSY